MPQASCYRLRFCTHVRWLPLLLKRGFIRCPVHLGAAGTVTKLVRFKVLTPLFCQDSGFRVGWPKRELQKTRNPQVDLQHQDPDHTGPSMLKLRKVRPSPGLGTCMAKQNFCSWAMCEQMGPFLPVYSTAPRGLPPSQTR